MIHYESLLARLVSHKKDRRAKPCDGTPIERIFNTSMQQFIYSLRGNTQSYQHFRKIRSGARPGAPRLLGDVEQFVH